MSRRTLYICMVLAALICCVLPLYELHAATVTQPTDAQWQQMVQDKAFNYKDKTEALAKPNKSGEGLARLMMLLAAFFSSGLGKLLLWTIFLLTVGWILYKVFLNKGNLLWTKKPKQVVEDTVEQEAEDIAATNWESKLRKAIADGDTRMAIRYSYMYLLQLLERSRLIEYRSDKTNYDYYRELKDDLKPTFRTLSRQYEYSWYGNFATSKETYDAYMQHFEGLKKRIGQL